MKNIIKEILEMPYYKNYAAASGAVHNVAKHEDAVQVILEKYGLKEYALRKKQVKGKQQLIENWLSGEPNDMPDNSFISQPCGTHSSPDFLVKENNRLYALECKSSKQASPMYNSGLPKKNYIYIFSTSKYDETTVFLGQDIVPDDQRILLEQHIEEQRKNTAKLNSLLTNSHGVCYYDRPMINHRGTDKDYFKQNLRAQFEQNVLEFVSG